MTFLELCCEDSKQQNKRKSRFGEGQIIHILREAEGGGTVDAVCTGHNVSKATLYGRKQKHGGLTHSARRAGHRGVPPVGIVKHGDGTTRQNLIFLKPVWGQLGTDFRRFASPKRSARKFTRRRKSEESPILARV